jgi:hypothetical protein
MLFEYEGSIMIGALNRQAVEGLEAAAKWTNRKRPSGPEN